LLSQIMRAAVENDVLLRTPCRGIRLPRLPEANLRILTQAQVATLVEHCDSEDRVLVLMLAYAGLRIGEALALRRRSIDLDRSRLVVSEAVAQLPRGSVIDTPTNHERRELVVLRRQRAAPAPRLDRR
jgi:integrase